MKFLLDEEIEIFPKIIFWFAKPKEITVEILLKFLRKDILFLESKCNFLTLYNNFSECRKIGLIINLDELIDIDGATPTRIIEFLNNIINPIKCDIDQLKIIIHSKRKDEALLRFFDDNNIIFFSNDVVFKTNKVDHFLDQMLNSVFDFSTQRTSLRLGFKNTTYSTEIIYNNKNYNGIIKDISLKGAGLVLDYEVDYNNIHIGDFVTLNIDFKVLFFKILKGIVIRKNQHENLLGIKIDLDDPYMIDNENMIILNRIIDSWITKLLSKEDILSSLK